MATWQRRVKARLQFKLFSVRSRGINYHSFTILTLSEMKLDETNNKLIQILFYSSTSAHAWAQVTQLHTSSERASQPRTAGAVNWPSPASSLVLEPDEDLECFSFETLCLCYCTDTKPCPQPWRFPRCRSWTSMRWAAVIVSLKLQNGVWQNMLAN